MSKENNSFFNYIKDEIALVKNFSDEYKKSALMIYSSSAAFFLFLSIIPFLVLVISIIPYVPITEMDVLNFLDKFLPEEWGLFMDTLVADLYSEGSALISVIVSSVMALWASGKGLQAISMGLNEIAGDRDIKSSIILRIRGCIYTIILLFVFILAIIVFVFGGVIGHAIIERTHLEFGIIRHLLNYRFLYEWIFLAILFDIMYAWIPKNRKKLRTELVGATFAGVCWTLFSMGFSFYLQNFPSFTMYGSFATIIILLMWTYVCMILLLAGALINKILNSKERQNG